MVRSRASLLPRCHGDADVRLVAAQPCVAADVLAGATAGPSGLGNAPRGDSASSAAYLRWWLRSRDRYATAHIGVAAEPACDRVPGGPWYGRSTVRRTSCEATHPVDETGAAASAGPRWQTAPVTDRGYRRRRGLDPAPLWARTTVACRVCLLVQ